MHCSQCFAFEFFFLMRFKINEGSKAVHCAAVYISFMLVLFQQWTNDLKKKVSCIWLWIMPLPGTLMNMTMQKHIFFFGEDLFTHAFVPAIQWTNICWIPKGLSICRIRWINIFVNGHGCLWLATDIHHSRRYACLILFSAQECSWIAWVPNSHIVSLYSISSSACCVIV